MRKKKTFYKHNLFTKQLPHFILFKIYWLGPFIGATLGGLVYDNAFALNASLEKARAFLLASEYEHDSYPAKKTTIKIIQEEVEEVNTTPDKPALESA